MAEYNDQTLSGAIALDGNTFNDIQFSDAALVFRGGLPPTFNRCTFERATFSFQEQAGNTVAFLNAMAPAGTNMRQVVLGVLPALGD